MPSPGPISSTRVPGPDLREVEDPLEHVGIGEEVLRPRVARPEALALQRPANLERIEPRRARRSIEGHRASGSDGVASRSRPDRSPARNRRAPAAPIIAPLSVHRPGRGTISGTPRPPPRPASRVRSTEFAATPPPSTIERAPIARAARIGLRRRARRRPRPGSPTPAPRPGRAAVAPPAPAGPRRRGPRRPSGAPRSSARRTRSRRNRRARPAGSARRGGVAASAAFWIAGPPGYGRPEQPPDLVERLARGVVDRLAEQPVRQVVGHLDEEGVAAADDERDERERRRLAVRPGRDRAARPRRRGPRGG